MEALLHYRMLICVFVTIQFADDAVWTSLANEPRFKHFNYLCNWCSLAIWNANNPFNLFRYFLHNSFCLRRNPSYHWNALNNICRQNCFILWCGNVIYYKEQHSFYIHKVTMNWMGRFDTSLILIRHSGWTLFGVNWSFQTEIKFNDVQHRIRLIYLFIVSAC